MSTSVLGTCTLMCPEKERHLREREGLLHVFEMKISTKNSSRPEADPNKVVKSYSRSTVGRSMTDDPGALRPGPILLLTIEYLFTRIITRTDYDWAFIYNFAFDRLRAVRQDMVVQRLDAVTSIKILEPIVRFHIYAAQRLGGRKLEEFIPKFNNQHLLECIKQLLVIYDERDCNSDGAFCEKRAQTEALYILLYMGSHTVLQRGLALPLQYRKSDEVQMALEISLAWYMKNYIRVTRKIIKLSPLLTMAAQANLSQIRRDTLQIMSFAYNSDILLFPGDKLREILLYDNTQLMSRDCNNFGLESVNGDIRFQKRKFNINTEMSCGKSTFSDATLHSLLPDIIFN